MKSSSCLSLLSVLGPIHFNIIFICEVSIIFEVSMIFEVVFILAVVFISLVPFPLLPVRCLYSFLYAHAQCCVHFLWNFIFGFDSISGLRSVMMRMSCQGEKSCHVVQLFLWLQSCQNSCGIIHGLYSCHSINLVVTVLSTFL